MTDPLFLAETPDLDALAPGDTYVLAGLEARHAATARRLTPGETLELSDGAGLRVACRIEAVNPASLTMQVLAVVREERPALRLALAQALAKGDRDELAVQAAVEVGADAIVPWQAGRSVVVWRGERAARNWHRWQAIVREATKQARRAFVPVVHEPCDTAGLVTLVEQVLADGGAAWVLDSAGSERLTGAPLPAANPGGTLLVIVGPEGGIEDTEIDQLRAAGARTVAIGPTILRTSTAGPAALAVLSARIGRW